MKQNITLVNQIWPILFLQPPITCCCLCYASQPAQAATQSVKHTLATISLEKLTAIVVRLVPYDSRFPYTLYKLFYKFIQTWTC